MAKMEKLKRLQAGLPVWFKIYLNQIIHMMRKGFLSSFKIYNN